ncbi:GDSL-type esterase/lipase family protein [Larkinella sp. VNQ87]|uniref:GDSL-type esterase/lipase family protein n=1 Tax=Larkinella sp. VNQ87 TaxID=3400921 RepID=UPI003C0FFB65
MSCPQKPHTTRFFLRNPVAVLVVFSIFLTSCGDLINLNPKKSESAEKTDSVSKALPNGRIACVGTSITQGEGIPVTEKKYPDYLEDMLGNQDTVQSYGVSGTTVLRKGILPYWNESAYQNALSLNPGIVIIELGTNDSREVNWQHKADFKADYIAFIRSFQALPAKPTVYICKPTPAFKAVYGIRPDVVKNEIMPLIDEVARETGVKVIDLYTPLLSQESLFQDGIHPNTEGAKGMAEVVKQAIRPN